MLVIGLTGGIASGKSEAARRFAALGVTVIDTDELAREVLAPGSEGLDDVVRIFGDTMRNEDGSLDRRALRRRIFGNARDREKLEAITHPRIRGLLRERLAAARSPYVIVEIPLLIGPDLAAELDRVLVVDSEDDTRLRRLMERDEETEAAARSALRAQAPRTDYLAQADDVIVNEGTPDELTTAVRQLHEAYLARAGA